MNKLTLSLLGLVLTVPGHAQDVLDETEEAEIRRYTVEVIIFRYVQDVGAGSEVFLPDEPAVPVEPGAIDGIELLDEIAPEPALDPGEQEEQEPLPDIELVLLEEDDYQLQETYGRLERLEVYEPLMHFGWTQATWPEEQTEAIPLHLFARPPEELDGTLKLYLGRYLHLVADLQLRAPDEAPDRAAPESRFDGYAMPQDFAEEMTPAPVFFRISEDRILRNGEVRYYDHPKFGLLARVTRVAAEEDPGEGELLGYPVQ
jgi:hypothetical protein